MSCDSNVEQGFNSGSKATSQDIGISKEQYGQLAYLLQQFQAENSSNMQATNPAVNFAGIITCTSSIAFDKLSCECYKARTDLWILDSGASHHMTFNKQHLTNILPLPEPVLVRLPNGYKVKVTEIGNVRITSQITLYNVLFIPSFKYNLISINSLTLHLKCVVSFSNTSCLLQAPSLKRPLEIGKAHDGLYLLCSDCLQKSKNSISSTICLSLHRTNRLHSQCISHSCLPHQNVSVLNSSSNDKKTVSVDRNVDIPGDSADLLWHYRLGHVPLLK